MIYSVRSINCLWQKFGNVIMIGKFQKWIDNYNLFKSRGHALLKWIKPFLIFHLLLVPLYLLLLNIGNTVFAASCVIFIFFIFILLIFGGDKIILFLKKAKRPFGTEYDEINEIMDNFAFKINIPRPEIFVVNKGCLNFVSLGMGKKRSSVLIQKELLCTLTNEELKTGIALMMADIKNECTLVKMLGLLEGMVILKIVNFILEILNFVFSKVFFLNKSLKRKILFSLFILSFIFILNPIMELIGFIVASEEQAAINKRFIQRLSGNLLSLEEVQRKIINSCEEGYLERVFCDFYFSDTARRGSSTSFFETWSIYVGERFQF